jgi:uncharacterized protein (DUF952 family)
MIFLLAMRATWERGGDTAPLVSPDTDPFVHGCDEAQIEFVYRSYFSGETDVLALGLDPTRLDAETRYEPGSRGEPQRFPHVYGPIHRADVVEVRVLG